ncbi:signal peptidase I [Roseomonas gilardii subsp. gilardii]|uniref:signal peptidase I n=1 Tax=Roseomonas gilardii TaxID=257708 RepID=UPI001FF8D277|nr:signal peptidase I [Roseomonas gilardii]UPG74413.1 signal peptidase I [Roseomonas gilardii subsp. gilardii]
MAKNKAQGGWVESLKTIVYAVIIAVGIRTVAFEPFNIPSGSMIPTLQVGDYLFVSKYAYGYSNASLPFTPDLFSGRVFGRLPARGDVVVFKLPSDGTTDYIKRIVGLPGDRIQMRGGILHVNGQPVKRDFVGPYTVTGDGPTMEAKRYLETLPPSPGAQPRTHSIIEFSDNGQADNTPEYLVPAGHLFAMGDNRDNSQDSRYMNAVGFVPVENLVGRAEFIFFSWDGSAPWWQIWRWPFEVRWSRIFSGIH